MSFKVRKITVGRGRTKGDEKAGEWNRVYYEVEADIEDESQIELAKGSVEALLETWLKGESISPTTAVVGQQSKPKWDSSKMKWVEAEGSSGLYQRSEDVDSLDFKEALKDLAEHGGKLSRKEVDGTWFYWKFEKSAIIGRKKRK